MHRPILILLLALLMPAFTPGRVAAVEGVAAAGGVVLLDRPAAAVPDAAAAPAPRASRWPYWMRFAGGFVVGLGEGAVGMITGTVEMLLHPIQTAQGLWHMVTNPSTIGTAISDWWGRLRTALRNDPYTAGKMVGNATVQTVATGAAVYGAVRGGVALMRYARAARAARAARRATEAARAALPRLPRTATPRPRPNGPYRTRPMDTVYGRETLGETVGKVKWETKYLSDAERAQRQLFVRNGKIYDAQGRLFDTRAASGTNPNAIWVMDEQGRIFASNYHAQGKFHHSSLAPNTPNRAVAAAGQMEVENGVLRVFSDRSGHYAPPAEHTVQALRQLESQGVDLSRVGVKLEVPSTWDSLRGLFAAP